MLKFSEQLLEINKNSPENAFFVITKMSRERLLRDKDVFVIIKHRDEFRKMAMCCNQISLTMPGPGIDVALYSENLDMFGITQSVEDSIGYLENVEVDIVTLCDSQKRENGRTLILLLDADRSAVIRDRLLDRGFIESDDSISYFHLPMFEFGRFTSVDSLDFGNIRDAISGFFREDE